MLGAMNSYGPHDATASPPSPSRAPSRQRPPRHHRPGRHALV